jgi:hypothetical protein
MSYTQEEIETARQNVLQVIPHLRLAMTKAAAQGKLQLGILAITPDGGGKIVARLDVGDFIEDLSRALNAPPQTEEEEREMKVLARLQEAGLI